MAVLSPSFLFGVVALLYLLSFVFFAIIRIATGVSIQRFGYFSLRRIAYTPRDGIRIDLRGLALRLHRPTFARPTYISLRLSELRVTFDPHAFGAAKTKPSTPSSAATDDGGKSPPSQEPLLVTHDDTWKKLTRLKESVKRLHDRIQWLSIIDLEISEIRAVVPSIGEIHVGSVTTAIDTRRQTVDRGRLFRHKKEPRHDRRPAEWMFVVKGILFTPEGSQALEILDILTLNIHGLLYKNVSGLRDVSISLKVGRINIPYDSLHECRLAMQKLARKAKDGTEMSLERVSSTEEGAAHGTDQPSRREEAIVRTVTESRSFMASILRGIQEIQLAVSFVGFTKSLDNIQPNGRPVYANISMNEIGVDLFRLDQKSPAHRMYFAPSDVAHQAQIAAISLAVGLDDGQGKPERILYVPMATSTIKTTLPSRTLAAETQEDTAERNSNMLMANFAVTSPSIDIGLKHIAVILALLQRQPYKDPRAPQQSNHSHRLISRLLPKASVRLSVQEPVARVVLPPADKSLRETDEYDLLISSISSISLGVESSHSSGGDLHYALSSTLNLSSEELYYQTAHGERHNLLLVDTLNVRVQIAATPEITAVVSGNLDTVSAHLVRPEISKGIYKILQQVRTNPVHQDIAHVQHEKVSFLRRLPSFLVHFQFKGSNLGIEVAGVDEDISEHLRGVALQLHGWSIDYRLQKATSARSHRMRGDLGSPMSPDESFINSPFVNARKTAGTSTDGRKLTLNMQGFEGFMVEGVDAWEPHPFLSIRRAELACSTNSDNQGQIFHIHAQTKSIFLEYSLYRYYAVGIASMVLRRAFQRKPQNDQPLQPSVDSSKTSREIQSNTPAYASNESWTLDIKTPLIQIKAKMPSDPSMMLQIYGFNFTHNRWANPFVRAHLMRLYAEAPKLKRVWARIVSVKTFRLDFRRATRIVQKRAVHEHSMDIQTDFIRIAAPNQLIVYHVFDNFINTVKATAQLNYRFLSGRNDYVLEKRPEGPKKVPKISLRSRSLMFELEDSPFDWKLDLIYRVGLKEQKQRLAREEAYRLKIKKLADQESQKRDQRGRQGARKNRGRSQGQSNNADADAEDDSKSSHSRGRRRSSVPNGRDDRYMHYDADAGCMLTGEARITADEAWLALQEYNASSWKKRIAFAKNNQAKGMQDYRKSLWGDDDLPEDADEPETVLAMPSRPGLLTTLINDVHIIIDKPSFPLEEYPKFLHDIGKGMPVDTKYSLLVPMNLQINLGETKMTLRTYPLPLLHIPALRSGQSSRMPSWSLKTDFVIAEEFRNSESIRHVNVQIVPPLKTAESSRVEGGFYIDVRRTVSPVKTYSNISVSINTQNPTTITWGTAYQPAIQDMMQTIESFTRPQLDPSEKVGFWDKIRLSFHSRARIAWTGDGDVRFNLKGSRDPYRIVGYGAGFVWCFRQGVRWDVHQTDDPKEFMSVSCGEYLWAIPDYSEQARYTDFSGRPDNESTYSGRHAVSTNPEFRKVIMKLSGNVRWLAGLVFERETSDRPRSFEFCKHYDVVLKTPQAAKKYMPDYDAFRNFRSQHIHLSIAVIAPVDRDWTVNNLTPSAGYNTAHLTPRFFTHFFDWWMTFQGPLLLPIRQGPLFPPVEKSSKKFGRHLATIKYNLLLSPLFLAHIYKHKDSDEFEDDIVRATGLKVKLDSLMLDMHQRRETFATQKKAKGKSGMTGGMKINQAQLDFINADFRAVSSTISGTSPETVKNATHNDLSLLNLESPPTQDVSAFSIPDGDYSWVDMNDFVELDWALPAERHPDVKIMPLAFSPRFTYFRQIEHNGVIAGDPTRTSQFGDEPTHFCVMTQENDPRNVQRELVSDRLQIVDEQIKDHEEMISRQRTRVKRDDATSEAMKTDYEELRRQVDMLHEKKAFMDKMLSDLGSVPKARSRSLSVGAESNVHSLSDLASEAEAERHEARLASRMTEEKSDFNNRFTVHNVQLKWNNSLRDIILRYVHQVSQRRGFTYYMTRGAVKFILDIIEEQKRNGKQHGTNGHHAGAETPRNTSNTSSAKASSDISDELRSRIDEMVKDGKKFVDADDEEATKKTADAGEKAKKDKQKKSEAFTAVDSYHVRLISPQIQLQSEQNPKSVLLVTARGIQLKVIQIMDKDRMEDEVSGLVQRRFVINMDGVQFFVTSQKDVAHYVTYYSHLRYGAPTGTIWPPWAPLEVNFDSRLTPFGWFRVVEETSIELNYDKYNKLRLKYNREVTEFDDAVHPQNDDESEQCIDHMVVNFPQVRAICDSSQYYTLFVIVSDLLLYSEPLEKKRNERLEKIMLAADFSDLTGTPEMVENLQERIRSLEEIREYFQLHSARMEKHGWEDRMAVEHDISVCQDELFFTMKAITSSQRKIEDRKEEEANGVLRWNISAEQLVWHLVREQNEPLAEFQLRNASFNRTDNYDGSNLNTLEVGQIFGLNLMREAIYPQMIAPYDPAGIEAAFKKIQDGEITMLKIHWHMLEAIAGIPVLSNFEIDLYPLKIQLEQLAGKRLFEYVFPPSDGHAASQSPFMARQRPSGYHDDDSDVDLTIPESPVTPQMPVQEATTRAGSLEMRLRPTLNLSELHNRPSTSNSETSRRKSDQLHHWLSPFPSRPIPERERSPSRTRSLKSTSTRSSSKKAAADEVSITSRFSRNGSGTNLSGLASRSSERSSKFGIRRSNTTKSSNTDREKPSDDLTEMMSRASNYMTLAYLKIPSVVLSLSYKGPNERNFSDVHDFVFTLPTIEYRNKTWSNMDLVLRLKKDVVKALISHTGAIIGNKLVHHRPSKHQQSKLRELATSSSLLPNSNNIASSLVRTATSIKNRSLEKASSHLDSSSDIVPEEDSSNGKHNSKPNPATSSGANGTNGSIPRMAINGRTFSMTSPPASRGGLSRPTSSALTDDTDNQSPVRPTARSETRESTASGYPPSPLQSPQSAHSNHETDSQQAGSGDTGVGGGGGGDDDAASAKRRKRPSMLNLGKKILGNVK